MRDELNRIINTSIDSAKSSLDCDLKTGGKSYNIDLLREAILAEQQSGNRSSLIKLFKTHIRKRQALEKPEQVEGEVMPPEGKNEKRNAVSVLKSPEIFNGVEYFPKGDKVIAYHVAAERCANLSIWCAAMAGAELLKKKKSLKRGEFVPYKESLPMSAGTIHNYMHLAKKLEHNLKALPQEELKALLPAVGSVQSETDNALELLNLPSPMDMFNPAHEQIACIIRKVTNEQTLRQLYFDWDIVKQPKQLIGGNSLLMTWIREVHPELDGITKESKIPKELRDEWNAWKKEMERPRTKAELAKMCAEGFWLEVNKRLFDHGIKRKTFAFLDEADLVEIRDVLTELNNEINAFIKQG